MTTPKDITTDNLEKLNTLIAQINELNIDGETFDYITDKLGFTYYVNSKDNETS